MHRSENPLCLAYQPDPARGKLGRYKDLQRDASLRGLRCTMHGRLSGKSQRTGGSHNQREEDWRVEDHRAGGRTKGSEGGIVDDPRPERKRLRSSEGGLNGCIS